MRVAANLRVLHVTEALGGGVQSAIAHFVEQTPDAEHTIYGRVRNGEETKTPVGVAMIPHTGSFLDFSRGLRRVIADVDPVAVHFHSSLAGALRPFTGRPRVIYSPHCFAFRRSDVSGLQRTVFRTVERLMGKFTDGIVAVSPYEAEDAARFVAPSKVSIVSNLAPIDTFEPAPVHGRRVVTVGRIAPQKDPGFFAEVAKNTPDTLFTWVGDGDATARRQLEDAGVEVTGWQSPEQIDATLRKSDLYLHTAAWEASPMSLVEALAVGLPVVCRDEPSLRSLGYLCVEDSPARVATTVQSFFDDAPVAHAVTERAAAVVESLRHIPSGERLMHAYLGDTDEVTK